MKPTSLIRRRHSNSNSNSSITTTSQTKKAEEEPADGAAEYPESPSPGAYGWPARLGADAAAAVHQASTAPGQKDIDYLAD
ncbi:hypothetical protein QQZ08_009233 [Neonectria magnoliae]|uniref:Uncharacterized protein n=1 Tax=Neonectria magnoliae TaxID=2732573 RepID=A0ABR1HQ09_9HYPO